MGERFDRLRYEVFQNLFLSPMNTGSVRPAVATTPTARGIETAMRNNIDKGSKLLQQHLPLAVLKPKYYDKDNVFFHKLQQHLPLAVLKLAIYLISFQNPIISKLQQHLPLAVLKPVYK